MVAPSSARRHGWTTCKIFCLVAISTFCRTGPAGSSKTAEQRGKRCPHFGWGQGLILSLLREKKKVNTGGMQGLEKGL